MRGLETRIANLERGRQAHVLEWVARKLPDGSIVAERGGDLAPNYCVLPEVCATTDEWIAQYAPGSNA